MKLQPPSMWYDPSSSNPQFENPPLTPRSANPFPPILSTIWSSLTPPHSPPPPPSSPGTPEQPPSPSSSPIIHHLQKRKDKTKTITETATETVTATESFTIHINQTVFSTLTTEVHFTHNITIFQPTTITQSQTTTTTSPLTLSSFITETPTPTTKTKAGKSSTLTTGSTTSASAAANSALPNAILTTEQQHPLSTKWILAIVFGVLGFLILLACILWGVRGFLKKYRRERVERKRLQMCSNEMPVLKTGEGEKGDGKGRRSMKSDDDVFAID